MLFLLFDSDMKGFITPTDMRTLVLSLPAEEIRTLFSDLDAALAQGENGFKRRSLLASVVRRESIIDDVQTDPKNGVHYSTYKKSSSKDVEFGQQPQQSGIDLPSTPIKEEPESEKYQQPGSSHQFNEQLSSFRASTNHQSKNHPRKAESSNQRLKHPWATVTNLPARKTTEKAR